MTSPGSIASSHIGNTSIDPRNLTGQLFMKGKRENTTLMLVDGTNASRGINSKEFDCGQTFEVPDHTVLTVLETRSLRLERDRRSNPHTAQYQLADDARYPCSPF